MGRASVMLSSIPGGGGGGAGAGGKHATKALRDKVSSSSMAGAQNRDEMVAMCHRLLLYHPNTTDAKTVEPDTGTTTTTTNSSDSAGSSFPKSDVVVECNDSTVNTAPTPPPPNSCNCTLEWEVLAAAQTPPPTTPAPEVMGLTLPSDTSTVDSTEKQRALAKEAFPKHPLCRLFATTTTTTAANQTPVALVPSAMSLWMSHLDDIHRASRLPQDARAYVGRNITTQLLELLSPRLPLSVKSVVRDWTSVDAIMNKAYLRYDYLTNQKETWPSDLPPPPPVKIVVMGGSVTMGINCNSGLPRGKPNLCAWSDRLYHLINQVFDTQSGTGSQQQQQPQLPHRQDFFLQGNPLVQIESLASGGTNSAIGARILEYDILPAAMSNPDIIINAYSTNDMHVLSAIDAQEKNLTLEEFAMDTIQDFMRAALSPTNNANKCDTTKAAGTTTTTATSDSTSADGGFDLPPPPLVIHWNDYLGNEQHEVSPPKKEPWQLLLL
jgi:hypothetical protein